MEYKLINHKTKETHFCDKVIIDGFDYYVSDFIDKIGVYLNEHGKPVVKYIKDLDEDLIWESIDGKSSACDSKFNFRTVIATNNPNIDCPKVVDEVEKLAHTYFAEERFNWEKENPNGMKSPQSLIEHYNKTFTPIYKAGYNKSQETHPFSEKDMIEFAHFYFREEFNSTMQDCKSSEEIFQLWKEQKTKIIWYA